MRNRKSTIALLIILSISLVGAIGIVSVLAAKTDDSVVPLEKMAVMDLTHENFAKKETVIPTEGGSISEPAEVGDTEYVIVSDDYMAEVYEEEFYVLLEGEHCLILITRDAFDSFDGTTYYFWNEYGTWGFDYHEITHAQLVYMMNEFDNNIYPTVGSIYAEPPSLGDEGQKVWILIFNIKDWAYYSEEADYYIAGYFSAGTNSDENKNIIHIDTYYWADRVGSGVGRPYLYEGTIAHEFEHLVHYYVDPDEESWVDEGLADLAGFFCGYGHASGHVANYLVYHPVTALTFWGSGLEDYGVSYLFQLYLYDHFGGDVFTSSLVQELANGIEGIQNTLDAWYLATMDPKYNTTFDEIYDAFTIAVYFDDLEEGSPYGFDSIDIGTEDTWGYSINYVITHMWFQPNPFVAPVGTGSPWGPVQPYTAHYYPFGSSSPTVNVLLEGDIESGPGAYSGLYAWYSDVGAWAWRAFYQTFSIPAVGDTKLKFMTYYEIEDYWDFGYVEVYDHTTGEWWTLPDENGNTMTDDPFAQDNPYVPENREPRGYVAAGRWNAFTAFSGGWIPIEMNLTLFAGHDIDLYFTTWQDGAFTYQMMYVDDINITGTEFDFFDDVESGPDGWLTRSEYEGGDTWYIFDCLEDNNWQGTFIETFKEPQKNPTGNRWVPSKQRELVNGPTPVPMGLGISWFLEYPTSIQQGFLWDLPSSPTRNEHSMVLIVSNRADHILPGMYYVAFF